MALKDLNQLATEMKTRYTQYRKDEFVLPREFKSSVTNINGSPIMYYTHTAVIQKNENQVIVLPNQWFAIASFWVEYKKELDKYKDSVLRADFAPDEIKRFKLGRMEPEELSRIQLPEVDKELLHKFLIDYNWWNGGKTIDRSDFSDSPILNLAGVINDSQTYITDLVQFFVENPQFINLIQRSAIQQSKKSAAQPSEIEFNQIFYGAPGTGKSKKAKEIISAHSYTRTTFHPDTDYASFVGSYKPAKNGNEITYSFIPQAFTKAYVAAWKSRNEPYYLLIEEINRGNCAQIFGDIFQLLDRRNDGYSEYTIDVDTDLAEYLESQLSGNPEYIEKIAELSGVSNDYSKLALPSNLYIIATMNTSDQSLFPMDSAFKRRWDWEYIPINYTDADQFIIKLDEDTLYSWGEFLRQINPKINELTGNEDKQLGNRFINPHDQIITFDQFRSKVMFYLWFEIYKDEAGGTDTIFKKSAENEFSFTDLFIGDKEAEKAILKEFFSYNGINPKTETEEVLEAPAPEAAI